MIPKALIELINKTDPNFLGFAYALAILPGPPPKTVFLPLRLSASLDFKTFRVEQLRRTNKDNRNPQGSWSTLSTHGSETPGAMLKTAFEALGKAQNDFVNKLNSRATQAMKLVRA
jgi:hypothetical protein